MPNNGNTHFEEAARLTVELVDHESTPNELSEAVMGTLLEMAYQVEISQQTRINIWHEEAGLSKESLAALYRLSETGAGYRRSRLYAAYQMGKTEREKFSAPGIAKRKSTR
jgi:hypothetical protein